MAASISGAGRVELRCLPSGDTVLARTASAAIGAVVVAERTDEPVNGVLGAAEQQIRVEYPNGSLRRRDSLASLGMSAAPFAPAYGQRLTQQERDLVQPLSVTPERAI